MKVISTVLLGLQLVSQLRAERFDSIPLADGSPSGFRLILPGTPAALAAQQQPFFSPSQGHSVFQASQNQPSVFKLRATRLFPHDDGANLAHFIRFNPQVHKEQTEAPAEPTEQIPSFQFTRLPASKFEAENRFVASSDVNVAPVPVNFDLSHTPASNQITSRPKTSQFESVKIPETTTQVPKIKLETTTGHSVYVLHNFDNSEANIPKSSPPPIPVTFKNRPTASPSKSKTVNVPQFSTVVPAKFVDVKEISGETLLDVRGLHEDKEEEVPVVTLAPVTPAVEVTTQRAQKVRVTVTKRVRGPIRKVVSKTTSVQSVKPAVVVQSVKPAVVLPTKEALQRQQVLQQEAAVSRQHSRFTSTSVVKSSTEEVPPVLTAEQQASEVSRQAQEASYSFTSDVSDSLSDSAVSREETRKDGAVEGSYSYSDGFFRRTVHYKADHLGYRVLSEKVEPLGDGPRPDPEGRADVKLQTSTGVLSKYSVTSSDIKHDEKSR